MIWAGIVFVGLVIGALSKPRRGGYWAWGLAAVAWISFVGPALFAAHGTLGDPLGDGVITHAVRVAANDGPWMGLYAVLSLFALFGVLVWLLRQALRQTYDSGVQPDEPIA